MLKIKLIGEALHISTNGQSSIMPMTNKSETEKVINTLIEVIYTASHTNDELKKSVMDDDLIEGFDTSANLPLLNDLMMNVPSHITKSAKDSLEFSPSALQPQVMKSFANAISRVYKDCAEMANNTTDTTLLSRSLFQKSLLISRDVELLADKIEEPLNKLKSIKNERILRKSVLKEGVKQGEILTKAKYGEFDNNVLSTARSIQNAKDKVLDMDVAIKNAKRVSRG